MSGFCLDCSAGSCSSRTQPVRQTTGCTHRESDTGSSAKVVTRDASPGLHRVPLGLQVALDAADGGLDGGVEDARPALRLRPQLLRQALRRRPLRPLLVGQRRRRLGSGA